ncbi:MAG: endolytic transglycosylase MltG [Saprospiraceae bacterium]
MKLLKFFLVLVLLGALAGGGFMYWVYKNMNDAVSHNHSETYITIKSGSAQSQILEQLAQEGIIAEPLAVRVYLKTYGQAQDMQAGEYQFKSPITAMEVLETLKDGRKRTTTLTIPEGWTRFEIAKRLHAKFPGEPAKSEAEILALMDDVSLIKAIDPSATNLEGYLYPTTYEIILNSSPEEVIEKMVAQFKKIWQPEWTNQAKALGRTPREIVTIASLIENESKFDSERPIVASVIYNRLDLGMALGIDATNVYIAKLRGKWDGIINKSDVEIEHPYNTRKIIGLPPGPISSASKSAFEAALNPAETDYIYYVLDVDKNDGSHNFYEDSAGFLKGKAKYQRWLATQRN